MDEKDLVIFKQMERHAFITPEMLELHGFEAERFCPDEIHSTVLGQTLTLLKSVAFLIEEMDSHKLNISQEEYAGYVINSSYVIID